MGEDYLLYQYCLPHNINYVVFLFPSDHQSQPIDFTAVFIAGTHNIDTRCFDAAMPQDICQLSDILFYAIKCAGEEFS